MSYDFTEMQDYFENEHFSDQGAGSSNQSRDPQWDCEMEGVFSIAKIITGDSENPKHKGRPFFVARLQVEDIFRQNVPIESPKEQSRIVEGGFVGHFNWLPRDPENVTLAEGYQLDEALDLVSAALRVEAEYLAEKPELFNEAVESDGRKIRGQKVGAIVTKSGEDDESNRVFFNPQFYSVDEDGNRIPRRTKDEIEGDE